MKHLLALLAGLVVGVAVFALGVIYNPFVTRSVLSPLAVSDSRTLAFSFSALASDSVIYTNNGESRIAPHPDKIPQLWEASIRQTEATAMVLRDGRNEVTGFGIKFSSASEETQPLKGKALLNSVWHVYLPGRGSLFIEQRENYWDYIRTVMLPAYRSSVDTWQGSWLGNITSGPEALGTARAVGGSGDFANLDMLAVESLSVRAWRVTSGPVAAEGQLTIELPADVEIRNNAVSASEL